MNTKQYLKNFFDEKVIPETSWEIIDKEGTWHLINSDVVIDFIKNTLEPTEQHSARMALTRIDYMNGDVRPFLKYIAEYIVNNFSVF